MHPLNSPKPQLTISLLISNRPDTIPRCLDSLCTLREQLPTELILVDTSGSDEIHDLLLTYTEQVYKFQWCNDFAKARNEGMKRAKGEWFMFLDDDEWFEDVTPIVEFFRSGEYKEYGFASHIIRNYLNVQYSRYSDGWVSRLIRLEEDTCFESKIHEYFGPIRGARKDLEVISHHSGYIYISEEKEREHFERNCSLLLEMITEEPLNVRWHMQLVQEYASMKEWERLEEACQHFVDLVEEKCGYIFRELPEISAKEIEKLEVEAYRKLAPRLQEAIRYNKHVLTDLATFYSGLTLSFFNREMYDVCIEMCEKYLADGRCVELLVPILHRRLAQCYEKKENWTRAEYHARLYFSEYESCLAKPEMYREQQRLPLVADGFDDSCLEGAYALLIRAGLKQGNVQNLCDFYEKLHWERQIIHTYGDTEAAIVEAMAELEYHPIFARVVTDAYRNRGLRVFMNIEVRRYEKKLSQAANAGDAAAMGQAKVKYERICYALSQTDLDDGFIWYAKMNRAYFENELALIPECVDSYFRTIENVHQIPERLFEMVRACVIAGIFGSEYAGVSEEELTALVESYVYRHWESVEAERWQSSVSDFLYYNSDEAEVYSVAEAVHAVFGEESWRSKYFDMMLSKYEYSKCLKAEEDIEDRQGLRNAEAVKDKLLINWVANSFVFYDTYYQEAAFSEVENSSALYERKKAGEAAALRDFTDRKAFKEVAQEDHLTAGLSYDEMIQQLYNFMIGELEYALAVYKDIAFEGDMEVLPSEIRAAVCLNTMFGRGEGDWRGMIADLRRCVQVYPQLANNIKCFIQVMGELLQG